MDDTAIYTTRRWTPPPDDLPVDRFDDAIQARPAPALIWYGEHFPEPPPMLVQDVVPQGQVAIVAGVFSSGKTFVVNDLAACVMTGHPFAGHEIVRPGAVLWLAAEGANEVDARIRAAAAARADGEAPEALPFARQAFDVPRLTSPEAKAELIELARSFKAGLVERFPGVDLVMIVIDTLGSAAGFLDGNNSAEAQRVMDMLRQVNVETGALLLVVDHFGKVAETGVMGASAKAQSAEAVLAILADKEIDGSIRNRRMAVHKLRGGASGATTPFSLRQVPVGAFAGTTCVVDWSQAVPADDVPQKAAKPAWSGNARVLKNAVERALIEHGRPLRPFGDEGVEVKATTADTVRTEFYASYAAENADAKRKAFNRLLDAALAKQLLGSRFTHGADHLWIVKDDLDSREGQTGPPGQPAGHRDNAL